jgi:DNA-directed RNA polymerase specialized sigma24 family protein
MSNTFSELLPIVEQASRSVARDYPGVDADDIYQELCVFVLENERYLKPEETAGTRYILYRAAHIYARKERAAGLFASVQYDYRPSDVRAILETAFSEPEMWLDAQVPDDAVSRKTSGVDGLDVTLDVRNALRELSPVDHGAIFGRYADGVVPEAGSAERKRLDRAVHRLTEAVNTFTLDRTEAMAMRGHPGSRRVISNATARASVSRGFDG